MLFYLIKFNCFSISIFCKCQIYRKQKLQEKI